VGHGQVRYWSFLTVGDGPPFANFEGMSDEEIRKWYLVSAQFPLCLLRLRPAGAAKSRSPGAKMPRFHLFMLDQEHLRPNFAN
jgi:hypothetical protein